MQLSDYTGAFDTFYKVLLTYEVDNDQRYHGKHCSRVIHHGYKTGAYEIHAAVKIAVFAVYVGGK